MNGENIIVGSGYISTGGSVYDPSETTPGRPGAEVPHRAELLGNYPNPFNPSAKITFSENGEAVRISIFDAIGREVRTIIDGMLPSGRHEVIFDAAGLPSGTYYCRMQSGNYQKVMPMLMAK